MYDEDEEDDDATARMSNCSSNLDNTVPEQPPIPDVVIENTMRLTITSPTQLLKSYLISDVKADDVAIVCTGKGLLPWKTNEDTIIMVRTLYCN